MRAAVDWSFLQHKYDKRGEEKGDGGAKQLREIGGARVGW